MELITYDASNTATEKRGKSLISLSRKSACSINKMAAERMNFDAGDVIAFHQDAEKPNEWYVSLSEEGFLLRSSSSSKDTLLFNKTTIAHKVLDSIGCHEERASFAIASEPTIIDLVHYWAIITAKPIIKHKKSKD